MGDDSPPLSDRELRFLDERDHLDMENTMLKKETERLAMRVAELNRQQANSPLETLRSAIALYADCRADPDDVAHRIRAALDGFESLAEQAVTEAEAQERRADAAEKRADENAERIDALEYTIEVNLPEYAYDRHDGTDDEANHIERVELAGDALEKVKKLLREVAGALPLTDSNKAVWEFYDRLRNRVRVVLGETEKE